MSRSDDPDTPFPDVARRPWVTSSEPAGCANEERADPRGMLARPWDAVAGTKLTTTEATLPGAQQSAARRLDGVEPSDKGVNLPEVPPAVRLRRLHDDQVLQIADGIRAETGTSYQGDPRVLAYRLGIDVVPGFPEAGEIPTATEAVFWWHHDPRERGIRIYCALARSFFLARSIAHEPDDVWALAIELVLPTRERWIGRLTLTLTQRFCPESVIRRCMPER